MKAIRLKDACLRVSMAFFLQSLAALHSTLHRGATRLGQLFGLRVAEMERVPKVLQFPVIIKGNRPSLFEPEPLQKFDFLPGGIAAEGSIVKEFFEPRLFVEGWVAFLFHKLKFLNVPRDHSFIYGNLHTKGRQVVVAGFNERL